MFGKLRKAFVLVLVFVLVASALAAVRAATISENWVSGAATEFGTEIVLGVPATLNLTIVSSDGDPFTPSNFPNADSVTVTGKFVDDYGNALDVNGDGTADVFSFTESATTPGLWSATINVTSLEPGIYTFRIEAIAQNTTTGEIFDNATLEEDIYVGGGKYWVLKAGVKDGDEIKIGSLSIKIASLSDIGAILDFGNLSTKTITDSNQDGWFATLVDVNADGTNDSWMVFSKDADSDTYTVMFYSNSLDLTSLVEADEDIVRAKDGGLLYENQILKDHNNYKAYVVWDNGFFSWFHATDYYIIPLRGYEHWKEGRGQARTMDVKIIKRESYFGGRITKDEEVFEGPIFNRDVKVDNLFNIRGKWLHNMWNSQYRSMWEILYGKADIKLPKGYELREANVRDLATTSSSELWRGGHNPLLNPSKLSFGDQIDWSSILNFEPTDESSEESS